HALCTMHYALRNVLDGWLALSVPVGLALALWVGFGLWLDRPMFLAVMRDWFAGPQWPWDPRTQFSLSSWLAVIARDVLSYPLAILLLATWPWRLRGYGRGAPLLALELYSLLLLAYTLVVSVKEVRHLIPWIPVAAILVGVGLAQALRAAHLTAGPPWRWAVAGGVACLVFLEASPLTLVPSDQPATLRAWLDPLWASRVFDNDSYLVNVRDAGHYLGEVTPSGAIIPVVHEGSVAGYYADRNYQLLYVLSGEQVVRILNQSEWLLVDKEIHPNMTEADFAQVKAYIAEHFALVSQFNKGGIPALVYRRIAPLSVAKNH
ncbi:MAG: hypothetical protein HYR94_10135, partial [Chloroflexi bacterium]|nr:hypothetical protein [Chloroflexota bacterium]